MYTVFPGDIATLRIRFYCNGTLVDPNAITWARVYNPSGTLMQEFTTVVKDSVGNYHITYTTPSAGPTGTWSHKWRWQGESDMSFAEMHYHFEVSYDAYEIHAINYQETHFVESGDY